MRLAVQLVLVSGAALAQPRLPDPHWKGANLIVSGTIGVGTSGPGGQAIHVANGNILIDGVGENALINKRSGAIGDATDPIFSIGRIIAGGINKPVFRWMYSDASTAERQLLDIEDTGTFADILDDNRRSMYEGYGQANAVFPTFRLNSNPDMRLELGPGGSSVAIGGLVRTSGTTVTATTNFVHNFGQGETFHLNPGETNFAAGDYVVASTPDTTHFTFTSSGSNVSSTAKQYVSADTDVYFARNGYGSGMVQLGGVAKTIWYSDSMTLQDGVRLYPQFTDSTGTPGSVTINKVSGRACVASGAHAVTVTDNLVASTTDVHLTPRSADATCLQYTAVAGSGSFVVTTYAAGIATNCTANWCFQFLAVH